MSGRALVLVLGGAVLALAPAAAAGPPRLQVATTLDPPSIRYGDLVTATVEVDYDPAVIDPSSIRLQPSFAPFVPTAKPAVRHLGSGALRSTYTLVCVTDACLPSRGSRLLRLGPVTVTALAGTQAVRASGGGPKVRISSRLTASDLSRPVRFRSPSAPPPAAYRVEPGLLAAGLIAAAALCALAALAIAGAALARLVHGSRAEGRSPLELAIAYVRDSARRSGPDRRRALSLLAEAADEAEPALAVVAAEEAWSEPSPTPRGATDLADRAARLREVAE